MVDLVVAGVVTSLLLAWSFQWGRLTLPPQYDDVDYLYQSLRWLHIARHEGLAGLAAGYVRHPAHAPLSDVLGVTSFIVFGVHDWAPYAGRGVLVVLLLLRILRRLMPPAGSALRWTLAAVAMTTPFAQTLVTEYRPDPVYGLLLAAAMLFVLVRPLTDGGRWRAVGHGALFAAVLLAKTSTYPQTLAFMLGALGLRVIADWLERRPLRTVASRVVLVVATAVLIPLPHYVVASANIHYYIHTTLFGERRNLWVFPGGPIEHALYYLTGTSGDPQLGRRLWVMLGILAAGAVMLWRRRPEARATGVCVLLTLAATYALPTINPTKSVFLGITFYFTLLLGGCWMLAAAAPATPRRCRWSAAVAMVVAAAAVSLWGPRTPIVGLAEGGLRRRTAIAERMFHAIRDHRGEGTPRLMLTATGTLINGPLFGYFSLKHDDRPIALEQNLFTDDPQAQRRAMLSSDLVFAGERGNGEAAPLHDSSLGQDESLALARSMPELVEVASVPAHHGKSYHLFVKAARLADEPFAGFDGSTGLSPPSGPFPQQRLPVMRSSVGPETTLRFTAPAAGPVLFLFDPLSPPPAQRLTVRLNGRVVAADLSLEPAHQFKSFVLALDAQAGLNELTISANPGGAAGKRLVHYRRLQVVPKPAVAHYE